MVQTYLTGVLLVMGISAGWLLVQRLWRRQFPECAEGDALANRGGCQGCTCGKDQRDAMANNKSSGEAI
jgi:hypothetical protein